MSVGLSTLFICSSLRPSRSVPIKSLSHRRPSAPSSSSPPPPPPPLSPPGHLSEVVVLVGFDGAHVFQVNLVADEGEMWLLLPLWNRVSIQFVDEDRPVFEVLEGGVVRHVVDEQDPRGARQIFVQHLPAERLTAYVPYLETRLTRGGWLGARHGV